MDTTKSLSIVVKQWWSFSQGPENTLATWASDGADNGNAANADYVLSDQPKDHLTRLLPQIARLRPPRTYPATPGTCHGSTGR